MHLPSPDEADTAIAAAIVRAYDDAGIAAEAGRSAIVPLRHLVAGQEVFVDEVPALTRRLAAAYLAKQARRPLLDPEAERADDALAGILCAKRPLAAILVNGGDPLARRRFTIAHELGHYFLHFLPDPDARQFDDEFAPPAGDEGIAPAGGRVTTADVTGTIVPSAEEVARMEDQADRFAAALLMPAATCARLARQFTAQCGGKREVLAGRLATELLVSPPAMKRRLRDLQLA